jgi:type IV pilus assembly protein PilC
MAPKESQNQEKRREDAFEEKTTSSALRDALLSKVQGEEKRPEGKAHVSAREIGAAPPEEEAPLSKPLSLGGPSYLDLAVFCRQFATLIEVGIPVLRAFQMMSKRTPNRKLRAAVENTAKGIEEGQMIHQSMARHTRVFTPLVVNIVRIGEMGGLIEDSLIRLADIMESKAKIKRKIISASMYPMVAVCVAVAVISVILIKAIPTFAAVYQGAGKDLPALTQFVINLSNFFVHAWWILAILVVLGIAGLKMWIRTPGGARVWSWVMLHTPVLRGVNQKIGVARSARTLGGLISAGIPLVDALGITGDTNENVLIADALQHIHNVVERGERMAGPLSQAKIFPPLVVDMIAIGEETGTLDRMLMKVADIYDVEVEATLNGLSSIIEPLLIILLGGVVIFIALAVLLPYFNLANVIQD